MQLVLHGGAREEGPTGRHLVEDAADAPAGRRHQRKARSLPHSHSYPGKPVRWLVPHVDLRRILRGAQQNIRRPVPKGHHLVGVGLSGDRFGPGQTCRTHQDIIHPIRKHQSLVQPGLLSHQAGTRLDCGLGLMSGPSALLPKSASLSSPLSLIRRFWGFRSLWRTFLL